MTSVALALGCLLGGFLALWGTLWVAMRRRRKQVRGSLVDPPSVDEMVEHWHAESGRSRSQERE